MSGQRFHSHQPRRWAALASSLALVLALTGCETGPKSGRVAYDCERGPGVIVSFERERARMFVGGRTPIHLERRPSRTGFWYESATHSIRGRGRRLDLTVGRMMPIRCVARGASRR